MRRSPFLPVLLCVVVLLAAITEAAAEKVVRIAWPVAEGNFDPLQQRDIYTAAMVESVFDSMLQYDYLARPVKLIPNTLESLPEVSADGTEFTFHLRHGIYFTQDSVFNGNRRELVARDYAYSLLRHFDPHWRSPWLFQYDRKILGANELMERAAKSGHFDYDAPVAGLEVIDRYTLRIRLAQPDYTFLFAIATPASAAMAREVVEKYGDDVGAHPVGTGPFKLDAWIRASKTVLLANPDFREMHFDASPTDNPVSQAIYARGRGKRLPLVDRVEFSVVEETQPRWLAFLNGEQDVLERVPYEYINQAAPGGKLVPNLAKRGVTALRTLDPNIFFTLFNMEDPVVGGYTPAKIALRRAISFGFDRDDEIAVIRNSEALPAQQPIGPGVAGYDPDFRNPLNQYDPPRAKALLDLFGYADRDGDGYRENPDGSPLSIELISQPTLLERQYDELWKRSMDAIGIRMTFRKATYQDIQKAARLGKIQMRTSGWLANVPDANNFLQLLYGPNVGQNNESRFRLPAFDRAYEAAKRLPDSPGRDVLYHEMTRVMAVYAPWKLGIYRIETYLAQPWVVGYQPHPIMRSVLRYIDVDPAKRPPVSY